MKLFEYEAKCILTNYGILVPKGVLVNDHILQNESVKELELPFAVKSQILVSGRQKAGGILFSTSIEQTKECLKTLLGAKIKNEIVGRVLIEEKINFIKELYFGITIDRNQQSYVVIASEMGGIDIEQTSIDFPQKIIKLPVNPNKGLSFSVAKKIGAKLGYTGISLKSLANVFVNLFQIVEDYDIELIELNPLVETAHGNFVALDSRIIIDDNALFRHSEYRKKSFELGRELGSIEIEAKKAGLVYLKLDGEIGIIGNGAGLVLATLDIVTYYGGKPANFLDLGGGASVEQIILAMKFVLKDVQVKVLFVNILGGLTRCDDVAHAIISTITETKVTTPVIVRLLGTNEEQGRKILIENAVDVFDNMEEATIRALEVSKGCR
ncbi:ADP-forming succinate--CoA ligase subunit beta [Candidatus Bathyarchaeota archaeon]|nr:ADP-forming succinate--CoA ligase subunit beta [Candidatus Bathyarchaeota archaeon]